MSSIRTTRPSVTGLSLYRGLEKNIYILFIIRIINRFGDFVQLLLVLILTGNLNLTPAQAGFFVSCSVDCHHVWPIFQWVCSRQMGEKNSSGNLSGCGQYLISFLCLDG